VGLAITIIKTVWYLHRNRQVSQQCRTDCSEMDPQIHD
jgi:hypothetical protein